MIDLSTIKNNIESYSSRKLCDLIICDRYFSIDQEISKICMEELAKRKLNGNDFDFENYIEINIQDLPELNLDFNMKNIVSQTIGKVFSPKK